MQSRPCLYKVGKYHNPYSFFMPQIPQVNLEDFQKFVTSNEVVTVVSAVIVTPLTLSIIKRFIEKVPFLKDHFTIGLIVAAFVIFILVGKFTKQSTKLRSIGIGIAAGVLITAIAPYFDDSLRGLLK